MKKIKSIFVFVIAYLLFGCVPVNQTEISTSTPEIISPTSTAQPKLVEPIIWPGMKDGWMVFEASVTPQIRDAVYDNKGFVWAASSYGVLRWNIETKEYTQYLTDDGLPGNFINSIILFQGEIWVGTNNGRIARFQNNEWVIENLDLQSYIISFSDTGDRLWVSSEKGLHYYDGARWREFNNLPSDDIKRVVQVSKSTFDKSLWFLGGRTYEYSSGEYIVYKSNLFDYSGSNAYSPRLVYRFDGKKWEKFENLTGAMEIISSPDGSMWFALPNILAYFNGDNWETIRLPDNQFTYDVQNISLDESEYIWLKTSQGYYKIRNLTAKEVQLNEPISEIAGMIGFTEDGKAIFLTGNPYPWSGDINRGISIYDVETWQEFSIREQVVPSEIGNLAKYKPIGFSQNGLLYLLSVEELVSFNGSEIQPIYDYGKINVSPELNDVYINQDDVWIDIWLTKIDSNGKIEEFFPNVGFNDFTVDSMGRVWLALIDGNLGSFLPPIPENFAMTPVEKYENNVGINQEDNVASIVEVDNEDNVWMFINSTGFIKFDGENWKRINFDTEFSNNEINPFQILDGDNIWAGKKDYWTSYLSHFDGKKWFHHQIEFNARPQNITVLDNGHVWYSLAGRVYFFDGKKMNFVPPEDDLMFDYVKYILLAPDGALWFFANDGVARYKP